MQIRAIISGLFIIILTHSHAYADMTIEIRPKKGFLILENFQHSVGMNYTYSGHTADIDNSDYNTHKFEELYHIQTSGAIIDRELLKFQLSGDIRFQQVESSSDANGSSSSNGSKYQYNLSASAYEKKWYPVSIHSSRIMQTVVLPFSQSYDYVSTNNGIFVSLLKGPVPTRYRYERNTLEISGSGSDVKTTSDFLSMTGSHAYENISYTSFGGSLGHSDSHSTGYDHTSDRYALNFGNNLYWGEKRNYSLLSQFDWDKTDTGGAPQQNINWSESLLGHLGKALDASLVYRFLSNETTTLAGQDQTYTTNSLAASITHRLYESLDTNLRGSVAQSDLVKGTQNTYSGSGMLTYKKKLPNFSQLTISLFGEHAVTDRDNADSIFTVRDEVHQVTMPVENIPLANAGPLRVGSVVIRGFSVPPPNPQFPTDITYTEEIDYTVDYLLGRIIWGAVVPSVPEVQITYESVINPSLKYASDTRSLSSSLSLLSGKYIVSGSIYNQDSRTISGEEQTNLYDTSIMRLRFEGHTNAGIYGVDLEDYDSGPTQYRFIEGWWLYILTKPLWALTLQARDRYTVYDSNGLTDGYDRNTFSSAANYSRGLSPWSQLSLTAQFIDIRREGSDASESFSAKANLRIWFNKLTINLMGQSSWRFYGESETRDDYVRIELMRYF